MLDGLPLDGEFVEGNQTRSLLEVKARGVFARTSGERALILLIDPAPDAALKLAAGWREVRRGGVVDPPRDPPLILAENWSAIRGVTGVHIIVAERR